MSYSTHTEKPVTILGVLARAAQAWGKYPKLTTLTVLFLFLQQGFQTVFAYSLKLIIDNVLNATNDPPLSLILAGVLLAFAIMAGASMSGEYVNARANAYILNDVRRRLHLQLQRLSADFYAKTRMGDILARFSGDMKALEAGYTQAFLNTILISIGLLINVPFLFYLEWRLALFTVLTLPILLAVVSRLVSRSISASIKLRESEADVVNMVQETVRAQQIIKTFVLENLISEKFDEKLYQLGNTTIQSRFTIALISKTSSLGVLLIQLMVMVIGATLAVKGQISVGAFVSFMTILNAVTKDVYEFAKKVVPVLIEAASSVGRIEDLLYSPVLIQDQPDALSFKDFEQQIQFNEVQFSYTGEHANLNQVNLAIPAGKSVVFVGTSGSGKSTLLSMIMRFYDPQAGAIYFDGKNIRQLTQKSLRAQMSAVFQENYLFNTSIRENIRLGRPDATDAEIEDAARAAEIHNMITSFPDGYDTLVGEGGGRLSGGQRQRVAIARAILSNPKILLLDEATSALDPGTESAVNATLNRLAKGRTMIAITHRLMSARDADQIFVMHQGKLAEQGTHDQLMKMKGVYYELWQKQSGFDVSKDGRFARVDAKRLSAITLFANLSDEICEEAASQFHSEYYDPGQTVIYQGEEGDKFYLIVRGQVKIHATDRQGVDHFIEVLEDGDHFGEMALLTERPRNATVETIAPCLFLTMSRDNLLGLLRDHPEMMGVLQARMDLSVKHLLALDQEPSVN
ncbi:MAG TPA: ATP-binding cassette domain-containing protein [Anaerolineales bacterium]|nr:ATP-binding cassette domain-containing protein [Anaerolineales bacterium]